MRDPVWLACWASSCSNAGRIGESCSARALFSRHPCSAWTYLRSDQILKTCLCELCGSGKQIHQYRTHWRTVKLRREVHGLALWPSERVRIFPQVSISTCVQSDALHYFGHHTLQSSPSLLRSHLKALVWPGSVCESSSQNR